MPTQSPQPNPQPIHQTLVVQSPPQSQSLPALVNAFCFPGLGQLIQGRLIAAICWWCLWVLAALSVLIGIGLVLLPLCWVGCVLDAAWYQPNASPGSRGGGSIILAGTTAIVVFLVVGMLVAMILGVAVVGTSSVTPQP